MSAKVYLGDAAEVLPAIPNDSVHLICTGPPFWSRCITGAEGELGSCETREEFSQKLSVIFAECLRVLAPGGFFVVESGGVYVKGKRESRYENLSNIMWGLLESLNLIPKGVIFWYNPRIRQRHTFLGNYPFPCSIPVANILEQVLVFKKPGYREKPDSATVLSSRVSLDEFKEFTSPVWAFDEPVGFGSFPLDLAKRLIRFYSYVGDTVLDPFLGTGTTARACTETARSCVGIEINPSLQPDIIRRLGSHAVTFT